MHNSAQNHPKIIMDADNHPRHMAIKYGVILPYIRQIRDSSPRCGDKRLERYLNLNIKIVLNILKLR